MLLVFEVLGLGFVDLGDELARTHFRKIHLIPPLAFCHLALLGWPILPPDNRQGNFNDSAFFFMAGNMKASMVVFNDFGADHES